MDYDEKKEYDHKEEDITYQWRAACYISDYIYSVRPYRKDEKTYAQDEEKPGVTYLQLVVVYQSKDI